MTRLEDTYPNVHWQFTQGVHVVRRSNQFWAGLSAYLVIEQVLTRSLNTNCGFTRGMSMPEPQRIVWHLPRPACTKVNNAVQQLTSVTYQTSEQWNSSNGCSLASHRDLLAYVFSRFSTCFKYRLSISIYPRLQLTTCDNVEVGVSTLRKTPTLIRKFVRLF